MVNIYIILQLSIQVTHPVSKTILPLIVCASLIFLFFNVFLHYFLSHLLLAFFVFCFCTFRLVHHLGLCVCVCVCPFLPNEIQTQNQRVRENETKSQNAHSIYEAHIYIKYILSDPCIWVVKFIVISLFIASKQRDYKSIYRKTGKN